MTSSPAVLGISGLFHDSAAALVRDGRILGAAHEERFTRRKGDHRFPDRAIAWCLGLLEPGSRPDCVAFYEDPALKLDRIVRNALRQAPRGATAWPDTLDRIDALNVDLPRRLVGVAGSADRVRFVPHHRSHAASAFYPSPFREAAVLVMDGVGEWSTTTIWRGGAEGLTPLRELRFPDSLGLLYSAFTQYCGFKVNSGEQKLMGLAPFGTPVFADLILRDLVDLKEDGSFALAMKHFDFATGRSTIGPLFADLFGAPARRPDDYITPHFMDVAASIQAVTDEIARRLARTALDLAGSRNLCLAGGVALNCVANTAILRGVPGIAALWIQPSAGDAGGALGAALDVERELSGPQPSLRPPRDTDRMEAALLGPAFAPEAIEAALRAQGLAFERIDDDAALCRRTAEALAAGRIVGHFDGRMEFGPRALGNRSILADPRPPGTLSRVNLKIKFREGWRPFAPIVLADRAAEIFNAPADSPYMLLVTDLTPHERAGPTVAELRGRGVHNLTRLQESGPPAHSAVAHVDYTSRIQTVDRTGPSRAGRILAAFEALTGHPLLMNTSFNVRGEPIVCSPGDAVACFLDTHLDMLVIGPFVAERSAQPPALSARIGQRRFDAD